MSENLAELASRVIARRDCLCSTRTNDRFVCCGCGDITMLSDNPSIVRFDNDGPPRVPESLTLCSTCSQNPTRSKIALILFMSLQYGASAFLNIVFHKANVVDDAARGLYKTECLAKALQLPDDEFLRDFQVTHPIRFVYQMIARIAADFETKSPEEIRNCLVAMSLTGPLIVAQADPTEQTVRLALTTDDYDELLVLELSPNGIWQVISDILPAIRKEAENPKLKAGDCLIFPYRRMFYELFRKHRNEAG